MNIPKIPLGNWIEGFEDWLTDHAGPIFDMITAAIGSLVDGIETVLVAVPAVILIVLITALAYWVGKWKIALFALIGLLLIDNLGLWEPSMQSLSLVLTAALLSIVAGVPIGIMCARKDAVRNIVTPVLDFMQTMPAFVY
ncbi:MAG: glycine/betaine ABC transporter, partial [Cohnella sp.]|nr:glycine/betaine ABC transporter [Cohnella sp.]